MATKIKHVLQQSIAWQQLSNVYELSGDYANALNAYKQFKVLQDSTIRGDREKEIKQKIMQSEFENEAALQNAIHEKKQAIAEGEIKNQRTTKQFIIGSSLIILIALLIMFILYKRRRDAKTKQKEAEFKLQVADTETKVLRLQMNPHFIFNSLNSISDYIVKNNISEADSYLIKFAKLMRMTLEHSEQTSILLSEELNALELYMQLECKRLNGKFSFVINIADEIDPENTMVPPLIFQPFIENSIWHGISKKDGKGNIKISISKKEGMLYCSIDDNGIGRINAAHNINKENKSLGMKITKARIEMLNSIKKTNAAVKLIDKPEGLTATISLPLELHF
ncbi:MAG: histidine kinase [Ferruginibacter sp.]